MPDPIPLPKDPRHQRFADLFMAGATLADAYHNAFSCTLHSAKSNSSRAIRRRDVAAYIAAVRQRSAAASVLSVQEKREFLARIVRTPITKLDIDTHTDADLIKSFARNETETGNSTRLEKLDALKAIELDNRIAGDDASAAAMTSLAAALAGLAHSPIPTDRMS